LSWRQSKLGGRHLAIALILAAGASQAAADILVVRSTGPSARSFPPGKSLKENGRITLQANDSLIVLDGRGTRTLRGPGTFAPNDPAQGRSQAVMSGLTSAGPQRRARIGAVRSVGIAAPRSPSIWHVDVAKSSNVCLADPSLVQLWRADATKRATLTVTRDGDNRSQTVAWPIGETTLAWPAQLPISDGASYRLSWPGAPTPTMLHFKTLPSKPVGLEDMASSLIQNQCEAQLDLLIETVRLPDDASPAG
jgi:hypothetical protein